MHTLHSNFGCYAFCAVVLFSILSCKKDDPIETSGPRAFDTSFIAPLETPQSRVVIVEEFTGVGGQPCYAGNTALNYLSKMYGDSIAIIGIQPHGALGAEPLKQNSTIHPGIYTRNDNRTVDGTDIGKLIYGGITVLPVAGIDRTLDNRSVRWQYRLDWANAIMARFNLSTAANLVVTSNYNSASRQAIIKVHVAYTRNVNKSQVLNCAIVEDNIIDAQAGGDTVDYTKDYSHQNVLRDLLTDPAGSSILSSMPIKQVGTVYERTFVYQGDSNWNPDNCRIVAYVSNNVGADQEVVQGAHTHLK
jgi:hypothetical protein